MVISFIIFVFVDLLLLLFGIYGLIQKYGGFRKKVSILVTVLGLLFLLFIVWAGWSAFLNTHNPFTNHLARYESWDETYEFPIHRTVLNIWQGYIFYDDYKVVELPRGYIITVYDYWYVNAFSWEKCDGELSFYTKTSFIPLEQENMPAFELIKQGAK